MDRRRGVVYSVIVVSLVAGLVSGKGFFFTIGYAFSGLLVMALAWSVVSANWIDVRRKTRAKRAQVGHQLSEIFTIQNDSILPKFWLELYDFSDLPQHHASHIISALRSRASASWRVQTLCIQRGVFQLGPLRLIAGDPFGLFQIERHFDVITPLVVYPMVIPLQDFSIPVGVLSGGDAVRQRTHQVTTNAAGVRDYYPGDSLNRIHWPSSARKNRLISKEFELDPLADVWLLMDADRAVHIQSPAPTEFRPSDEIDLLPNTEEYAITISASLAQYFLMGDRMVGFATQTEQAEIIQTDRGARQLTKILETLAVIDSKGTMPFGQFIEIQGSHMTRGTSAVLITPSMRDDWILAAQGLIMRGLRVAVVLIDGESFGGRPGARLSASRLSTMSIPCYIVRRGDDIRLALSNAVNT